jgi:succinate-acetate transporter protein
MAWVFGDNFPAIGRAQHRGLCGFAFSQLWLSLCDNKMLGGADITDTVRTAKWIGGMAQW